MPKSTLTLILGILAVVAAIAAFVGGRWAYFGTSEYAPPARGVPQVNVSEVGPAARLETVDNPATGRGVLVIDDAHRNAFEVKELNVLLAKIVSRGFSYEVVAGGEDEPGLADKLRYADALILALPRSEYSAAEVVEIERFVEEGGRLLVIGDPTRTTEVEALNSIGGSFGLIFADDYLYNLDPARNDNNYRNVVYSEFGQSPLTRGLDRVIFYGAGSIHAPGYEMVMADDTTQSSTSEGGRTLAPAVLTMDNRVLALGDVTFLAEPYSAAESNGALVNNIAEFITGGRRLFELQDFPFFLDREIDIVFNDPQVFNSQFADAAKLKEFLEAAERKVAFADQISAGRDSIFIGRFDDAEVVKSYLAAAKITLLTPEEDAETAAALVVDDQQSDLSRVSAAPVEDEERFIDGRIRIEGIGDLERGGTSLFLLDQNAGRNVLIILSDSPDTNEDALDILLDNKLPECLVSPGIAVCQTKDPKEQLPPSLRRTRIERILIIADNDGRPRPDPQTNLPIYSQVLSATYTLDTWVTAEKGSPDLAELQKFDAIIWTTGNYWDDSIGEEDATLLTDYVRAGGNLILSGDSIAFDWDHTDFLTGIVHADYLDFAPQNDLELVLPDHPIAEDFVEGVVITLTQKTTSSSTEIVGEGGSDEETFGPDVVRHAPDARVIFQRGPDSQHAGAAAVIAFEDKRSKIAYFALPVYLLQEETGTLLLNNTVDWFSDTPLDLPGRSDYKPYEPSEDTRHPVPEETQPPADGEASDGASTENETGGN